MSGTHAGSVASPFRQPKAVFAVAFACVVSFMGIGLVDPILPAISNELHASPSEVTLLFTSYTQEEATAGDVAIDGESLDAARAVVRNHLDRLAAHHVPAEGQILLHAADHGAAGRMVAEYANTIGARTIVIGAPSHGGLPVLMDGSASRELWRNARSNVLIVNPDAPGTLTVRSADAELFRG